MMAYVFKISALYLVVGVIFTAIISAHSCPPFWTQFGGSCYRFRGEALSFNDARVRCSETVTCDGTAMADLVSIHSEAENNFVYRLWRASFIPGLDVDDFDGTANRANSVWIGANDHQTEGSFVWTDDGGNADFQTWRDNQPDNYQGREDCVSMWKTDTMSDLDGNNTWNDLICDWQIPFVCKMPDV